MFESPQRKEAIVDYIIQYHEQKTQNRNFCAMMCVQDIDAVIHYYEIFNRKKLLGEHNLRVTTIFSYAQNEEEMDANMVQDLKIAAEPQADYGYTPHRRELLERYVNDFNAMFGMAENVRDTEGFYNYYNAVAKKSKHPNPESDILLVANMFLTGYDSKNLNTLYVDKNLQYHGLIQAFSRTNRILDKNKTQGNIVCFRNLKDKTDEAIALFSNKEAIDEIIVEPYEVYVDKFNQAVQKLREIVPQVSDVDDLYSEEDRLKFILAFRAMIRLYKKMSHYTEFTWEDLDIEQQIFDGYTSKYLDLKERIGGGSTTEKTSILNDIDFELELIRKDTINVTYILQLLLRAKQNVKDKDSINAEISNLLDTQVSLRSKRELIEKFIQESLPNIEDTDAIPEEFEKFWNEEQDNALKVLIEDEKLSGEKTERLIENYLFSEREPLRSEILDIRMEGRPSILKSKEVGDRILNKILNFVNTFVSGMAGGKCSKIYDKKNGCKFLSINHYNAMEKKTLSNILEGKVFQIPDYQRGYAWETKQWEDFVQDIDALIDDKIVSHYTGTVVIYQPVHRPTENYGTKKLEIVEIVDGQQRLTTCSIYLSIILNKLIELGSEDFKSELPIYLYSGGKSKLRLNNDTADFYFDLLIKGVSNIEPASVHQKRLHEAYLFLRRHVEQQLEIRGEEGEEYLRNLFDAIIRKLNFSFYPIEVESEIGMTFELMNSRGKDLSSMELLKNYLMYWVYRNIKDVSEKEDVTRIINKTWKEVFVNIAKCGGSENQCLRIAWTLYVNYDPKSWDGYSGFKSDYVIPLRDFSIKHEEEVKVFLLKFLDGLAIISKHYSAIIKPSNHAFDSNEFNLLTKIRNTGNIANYLPLMIASRIKRETDKKLDSEYIKFLKSLEMFSYRVFLWEGKRSNAGLSKFYRWADDIFSSKHPLSSVTEWIYGTINWYSPENLFRKSLIEDFYEWYHHRRLLKYTLFEYEIYLLDGRNKPKLNWEDLNDSSIEHILPQNPDVDSKWLSKWNEIDRNKFTHDISNLVLTKDNSRYSNFEFERKKGVAGTGYSYSNSDIRQERKIAEFDEWTCANVKKRREEIINWIIENWGMDKHFHIPKDEFLEEEEELVSNNSE